MGCIMMAEPVKLFIGMLFGSHTTMEKTMELLQQKYGNMDIVSPNWNFHFTNYYANEMGNNLFRKFLSFQNLIDPAQLKEIKLDTNQIEQTLSSKELTPCRPINLDPGYLTLSKVILATTKDYTHRIYLGKGIYAEVTLYYQSKKFCVSNWTYPDYQSANYLSFFEELRILYKKQLRETTKK